MSSLKKYYFSQILCKYADHIGSFLIGKHDIILDVFLMGGMHHFGNSKPQIPHLNISLLIELMRRFKEVKQSYKLPSGI